MSGLMMGGIFVVPLRADLRINVKDTFASGPATRVEYCKGSRWRSDSEHGYRIVDSLNKRAITADPAKREYSVNSFTR